LFNTYGDKAVDYRSTQQALRGEQMSGRLTWSIVMWSTVGIVVLSSPGGVAFAQAPPGAPAGPRTPPLLMTSPAWEDGGVLPNKYTQAAPAGTTPVSPALNWTQVPAGTQSFVLIMHDAEGTTNKSPQMDVTHWVVWNIPATATGLPENVPPGERPDGTRQISLRAVGYMGPGFPGPSYHHYTFDLYALDAMLTVPVGAIEQAVETRTAVFNAMTGHVLGKAVLIARFHR
jgi:Raf kinase inhibitor-like YbhB/YbcL family protein